MPNITIPASTSRIDSEAFSNCKNIVMWVYKNSYAHKYCNENAAKQGFTYKIIEATAPTTAPTIAPTVAPTTMPTVTPAIKPTDTPTAEPTATPTTVPTAEPTNVPTISVMKVSTSGKRLNMRSSASSSGTIITKLNDGDKVDVLSIANGWAHIRATINGTAFEGYVSAKYLKVDSEPTNAPSTTPKPDASANARVSTKGSKLKLRTSASPSASVIISMPNGSSLKVLETVDGWCRVQYTATNGTILEGWASSRYITIVA